MSTTSAATLYIDGGNETDSLDLSRLTQSVTTKLETYDGAQYAVIESLGMGFRNFEAVIGSSLTDRLIFDEGNQLLFGGSGDDYLSGGAGDDFLEGGAGGNWIDTGSGSNRVIVGEGDYDEIEGQNSDDRLFIRLSTITGNPLHESSLVPIMGGVFLTWVGQTETYDFEDMNVRRAVFSPLDVTLSPYGESPLFSSIGANYYLEFRRSGSDLCIDIYTNGKESDPTAMVQIIDFQDGDFGLTFPTYAALWEPPGDPSAAEAAWSAVEAWHRAALSDGSFQTADGAKAYRATELHPDGSPPQQGTGGDDTMNGNSDRNVVEAKAGNDNIAGGDGDDSLYGDEGNDDLDGGEGDDYLDGGSGDDEISGGTGGDEIQGGEGNDTVSAGEGSDTVLGNAGDDVLNGNGGDDILDGNGGADEL